MPADPLSAFARRVSAIFCVVPISDLQVNRAEGLWVTEVIFAKSYNTPKHRHTGPVWGYTFSGSWHYLEYEYVNRAGSFIYEPANSNC